MLAVEVMEFDAAQRKFLFLQKVGLIAVPTKGDKVVLKVDNDEVIFKVYDVHYFANSMVPKVNVIRVNNIKEYNSSGFSDINYYVR